MPSLIVPSNEGTDKSNTQPMSIGGVASQVASGAEIGKVQQTQGAAANASAAQIGQVEQNMGSWMGAQGNELLARGLKSTNDAIYNIVQSNAMKDYNKQAKESVSKKLTPVDDVLANYEKANLFKDPEATSKELDTISQNVQSKFAPAISDPNDQAQFKQSLSSLNENHKLLTNAAQRTAQIGVSQKALSDALTTDVQSGLIDAPENIGFYAQQGINRIQKGLESGVISIDQATKMGEVLRKGLYLGVLEANNQTNPSAVNQLLSSKTPQELNITDIEYKQLVKQNQLSMHDADKLSQNQYKAQNEIDNAQRRYYLGSLNDGIKDGSVGAAQIQEAYDKGKIDFPEYTQLAKSVDTRSIKVDKTWQQRQDISAAIKQGEILSGFDSKQIDDHYTNSVKNKGGETGQVSMIDKVDIAKHYQGPVNALAKDIQYSIMSGKPEQIKEAVFAFNKIQAENPLALSGVKDKKFMAYASALSNAYQYTTAGLDSANIQKIHDSIYNVDGRTLTKRANNFAEEDHFSDASIKKTIAGMYDSGDPWYRSPDSVPQEMVDMIRPLFRDAYNQSGDADTAIAQVANQTKALIGHTNVNDVPKWGIDSGTIMALPPERVYAGKATAEEIRATINKEIAPLLPKGLEPDRVMVGSDSLTMHQAQQGQPPSYYLYYKDEKGLDVLLPQRWKLDANSLNHINEMKANIAQSKVADNMKIAPKPITDPNNPQQTLSVVEQHNSNIMKSILYNTKSAQKEKIFSSEFIDKAAQAAYIPQIASHYPGDKRLQPIVAASLQSMVGKDTESWRVAQSMKLVNSVLVNNAAPKTYLKFGTNTSTPSAGDIVVSNNGVGLFGGMQNVNGQLMTKMINMKNGNLSVSVVPTKEVLGYRSLPTPENFYKQDAPLSIKQKTWGVNMYTGGPARDGTGQERFNPYDMTSSLKDPNAKDKTQVYNPVTGEMVQTNKSFEDKMKDVKSSDGQDANVEDPTAQYSVRPGDSEKQNIPQSKKTTANTPVSSEIIQSVGPQSNDSQYEPFTGNPKEGDMVLLADGSRAEFVQYENDKIRLKNGKVVSKSKIKSFLRRKGS